MGRRDQYGDPGEGDYEDDFFRKPMPPELVFALVLGALMALGAAVIIGWRLVGLRAAP